MKIKEKPFISFIIPSMNEKKYIRKCIESVLMNNYPQNKIEILVSDGFSKDGTREIVKEFSKKYNFIKLIDNEEKPIARKGRNTTLFLPKKMIQRPVDFFLDL